MSKTTVKFCRLYRDWEYYLCRKTPIINLGKDNDLGIYFSHKDFNPVASFEEMERFYEAYSIFLRYLKNPDYQYCFKLTPGDLIILQNFRILHGRKAFVPNLGHRELNRTA